LLPEQTAANSYQSVGATWIEVPKLNAQLPIVGVPLKAQGWDLTWLDAKAGYLEGTAFPGLPGNTAITAHVYLPDGSPGPFVDLHTLIWGDEVVLHANGQRYIYQVRTQRKVWPNDLSTLKHEDYDWITLITCQGYDEKLDSYDYRIAVRAVLIDVQPE
jgi:LPXTG-site transpeptidase (sortase) family protein